MRQEEVSSKARGALEWDVFYSLCMLACHVYETVYLWFLMAMLCLLWQIIEMRQEGVSTKARSALEWGVFYSLHVPACYVYETVYFWVFDGHALSSMTNNCLHWWCDEACQKHFAVQFFWAVNIEYWPEWVKNIKEERDCPIQILFGAMNPLVCPLLNLVWCGGGRRLQLIIVWWPPFY